jgi:hypothetical protein
MCPGGHLGPLRQRGPCPRTESQSPVECRHDTGSVGQPSEQVPHPLEVVGIKGEFSDELVLDDDVGPSVSQLAVEPRQFCHAQPQFLFELSHPFSQETRLGHLVN